VSWKVMWYAYGVAGVIEILCCYLGFFLVFDYYNVDAQSLFFSSQYWQLGADPLTYGDQVYDDVMQVNILTQAQTCYWVMLTGTQFIHIFLCKTRVTSVFQHGLFNNMVMNYGVLIEACIIVITVYTPGLQGGIGSLPFPPQFWALLLVSWTTLILYNEGSKFFIRKFPNSGFVRFALGW